MRSFLRPATSRSWGAAVGLAAFLVLSALCYGPFVKNCNTGLLEEVSDTTTEEYSAHEVRAFGHRLEFAARQVFEFAFGLGLMGFQFLMLQMIPDLFIGIPVGRVFR